MTKSLTAWTTGLLLTTALPAFAQDGLCGGAGDNGQWIGGSEMASDIATAGNYAEQMALVLMRNEYVSLFTLSAPTEVRIEAQGRGSGDPVMDVRDASGEIIISDDDSGGNGAARVETLLDAGTYCVSMRSFDGSPMTGFVRVGQMSHEPLTDGFVAPAGGGDGDFGEFGACNSDTPATPLGNGPVGGMLAAGLSATNPISNVPFYRFSLDAATQLSLTAENEDADPVMTLYDSNGNVLAENDDFDGLNSRIDMTAPLAAGDYCIGLTAYNDDTLPVTVSLFEYNEADVMRGLYNRGEASPPLDGSHPVTDLGVLSTRLRQDVSVGGDTTWFSMDVEEGGLLLIEAIAQGEGDPVLVLFDDLGREVAYNDDFDGLDSQITARVQRGTYVMGVRQIDNTMQGFIRILAERYVPAQ